MNKLERVITGGREATGAEFRERVLRVATGLRRLGVEAGDRVAVLMRNDMPLFEVTMAAQHLGAYPVQLNWHSTATELSYLLADCTPRVLIAHADLCEQIAGAVPSGTSLIVCVPPQDLLSAHKSRADSGWPSTALEYEGWLAQFEPYNCAARSTLESIIYTSGTTGLPKGVRRFPPTPQQQRSTDDVRARVFGISPGARALLPAPAYHAAPNLFAQRALRTGSFLAVPVRFDPEKLLADIEHMRITHLYVVPTMFVRLLALPPETLARYDVSSLTFVLHAGGPCAPSVKRRMLAWWGPIIHEYYGSTETGTNTFVTAEEWLGQPGTIGRAVDHVRIEVHDEDDQLLGPDQIGELWVANDGYADFTYLNQPESRAEIARGTFVATGDVGYITEDGYVFLCDRKRDMVISGGVNIYPAEIEARILALGGVADCAVFGIPDNEFGEALAAVVEPLPGVELTEDSVKAFVRAGLSAYKTPRVVEIRTKLPREDSGKIRKRVLRDPFWANTGRSI